LNICIYSLQFIVVNATKTKPTNVANNMDSFNNADTLEVSIITYGQILLNYLTVPILEGIQSIFNEAKKICDEKREYNRYLKTFQELLPSVKVWTDDIVDEEVKRIIQKSNCNFLTELITCVHIIKLKALTAIRVSNQNKVIDITTPNLNTFIKNVYVKVAREFYTKIHLFKLGISGEKQMENRMQQLHIIKKSIIDTINDTMPVEQVIRSYLDETVEQEEIVQYENIPIEENQSLQSITQPQPTTTTTTTTTNDLKQPSIKQEETKPTITFENIPKNPQLENIPETIPSIKNADNIVPTSTIIINDIQNNNDDFMPMDILQDFVADDEMQKMNDIETQKNKPQSKEEDNDFNMDMEMLEL